MAAKVVKGTDIAAEIRQATVAALGALLKPGGRLWIWEPTRESHGMPVGEIRDLMASSGLTESARRISEKAYEGVFLKDGDAIRSSGSPGTADSQPPPAR